MGVAVTPCTWAGRCWEPGRYLAWKRWPQGDISTVITCGRHLRDATTRGYRYGSPPGSDTERFELTADRLRELAEWMGPGDVVAVDLTGDVAAVVRQWQAPT